MPGSTAVNVADPAVLERQGLQDGGVAGPLQLGVQRRPDRQAAALELLLRQARSWIRYRCTKSQT